MEQTKQTKFIDERYPLTQEDKEFLSEKTGYSIFSIDQILRGYIPHNERHNTLISLYQKMVNLKRLHRENYLKDLNNI